MGIKVVVLLMAIFLMGMGMTQEWNEFVENETSNGVQSNTSLEGSVEPESPLTIVRPEELGSEPIIQETKTEEESAWEYTTGFYFAIGAGVLVLIIIIFLVFSLFKKPKNKWDK